MAGRPAWAEALRALRIAFSTKVSPVSAISGTRNSACGTTSISSPDRSWLISRTLPGLLLASTTRFVTMSPARTYRSTSRCLPSSSPMPLSAN